MLTRYEVVNQVIKKIKRTLRYQLLEAGSNHRAGETNKRSQNYSKEETWSWDLAELKFWPQRNKLMQLLLHRGTAAVSWRRLIRVMSTGTTPADRKAQEADRKEQVPCPQHSPAFQSLSLLSPLADLNRDTTGKAKCGLHSPIPSSTKLGRER